MFRTKAMAAAALVLGVGAGLVSVDSALATRASHGSARSAAPAISSASPAVRPPLPPVTEHAIPAWRGPARAAAGGGSAVQVIRVEIVGGELRLVNTEAVVELTRDGAGLAGTLPPVQVVDARGTHEGWTVRYRIVEATAGEAGTRIAPGKVSLSPSAPVVVDGTPDGLTEGSTGTGRGRHRLFSAARRSGGGTYEAGGRLHVRNTTVDAATVRVVFDVT